MLETRAGIIELLKECEVIEIDCILDIHWIRKTKDKYKHYAKIYAG